MCSMWTCARGRMSFASRQPGGARYRCDRNSTSTRNRNNGANFLIKFSSNNNREEFFPNTMDTLWRATGFGAPPGKLRVAGHWAATAAGAANSVRPPGARSAPDRVALPVTAPPALLGHLVEFGRRLGAAIALVGLGGLLNRIGRPVVEPVLLLGQLGDIVEPL